MFKKIISLENLLAAWTEFKRGKTRKLDVQEFYSKLEENLFTLHYALQNKTYTPELYVSFYVSDPKLRHIHKASVRDRVVHQALFRILYPIFDKTFIHDSYSCRVGKGTHRGVKQLHRYLCKVSANYTHPAYALKCDIKTFFASIDHSILMNLLKKCISDPDTLWLCSSLVDSFSTSDIPTFCRMLECPKGLPLGNVTSQLFANIYLNELDQFVKHELKAKYYLRYCDDFIVLSPDRQVLFETLRYVVVFLEKKLKLNLHPRKVTIRKINQGVDFLGYVLLPRAIMVRASTKRRLLKRINKKNLQSYLGVLVHANTQRLRKQILAKVVI